MLFLLIRHFSQGLTNFLIRNLLRNFGFVWCSTGLKGIIATLNTQKVLIPLTCHFSLVPPLKLDPWWTSIDSTPHSVEISHIFLFSDFTWNQFCTWYFLTVLLKVSEIWFYVEISWFHIKMLVAEKSLDFYTVCRQIMR